MEHDCSDTPPSGAGNDEVDVVEESLTLCNLSSLRCLMLNPSTPDDFLASVLQNLTASLHRHSHHHSHHHVLSLLSHFSHLRPHLSNHLFTSILSLTTSHLVSTTSCPLLAAESLSLLLHLSDSDPSLRSAIHSSLEDGLLVSLCFRSSLKARMWTLRNLMRFHVRPNVLITLLLGLTQDPYPLVRKAALDGLTATCEDGAVVVDDPGIVEGCYRSAIVLLKDGEECVRVAAVRAVIDWGKMLVQMVDDADKIDYTDTLFLLLCSVVRDMSVNVRLEALYALGRVKLVSEDILLQSLSKRVLGSLKEKKPIARFSATNFEVHASSAAGVFVHGLEDEFSEVRQASCKSLRQHITLSVQFASEAVTLLMDALNDDSLLVRLEVIETLHHMIRCDCLTMQKVQLQMLLSTLADKSPQIRVGAVKILGSMKYPHMEMLKLSVECLLGGLEIYLQNEAEFLLALFMIVQNNQSYAVGVIQNVCHEISSTSKKLVLNGVRVIGLVVVAISASLSHEACPQKLPPRILSYAAVYFGRISLALGDVVDKDTLLTFLSCREALGYAPKDRAQILGGVDESGINTNAIQLASPKGMSSSTSSLNISEVRSLCARTRRSQQEPVEILESVNLTFASIKSLWSLIKSGCISEALKALRSCKEELELTMAESVKYSEASAFRMQYVRLVKWLAKLWEHHLPTQNHLHGMGQVDIALVKFDRIVMELRYRFSGLSKEDQLYLLELAVLSCLLRLSRFQSCCITLKKLSAALSQVAHLCEADVVPSEFVNNLAKISKGDIASMSEVLCTPHHLKKLLDLFHLKDFNHLEIIKHKRAKLLIPGFDVENPLTFIPGLPVGIPLDITVHNATSKDRLWLKLSVDEFSEFVFLDLDDHGDYEEVLQIVLTAPFYGTPNAVALSLRISVGMECLYEDLHRVKIHGGPRHPLTPLCQEKEVYLTVHTKS